MGNKIVQKKVDIDGTPFLGPKKHVEYLTDFFQKELPQNTDHEKLQYLAKIVGKNKEISDVMKTFNINLPPVAENIVSDFFEKLEEPQAMAFHDVVKTLDVKEE